MKGYQVPILGYTLYTTVKLRKETKALLDELLREEMKEKGEKPDYDSLIKELIIEKLRAKQKILEKLKEMRVDVDLQGLLKEGRKEDERF
ncbi:hypothetical protein IPA_06480 [Ignicoccus pacificus DSM 13166]|uniref:Uncharacterized protein n=1 Tax=Ignicoccus pacificus DSM 13166 TaxID=940294 RepID=A0A977KBI3_9CREN|nr:hypothetical protein IPA_06480 [Ignicoccus pacificus DSM 13166]